jgi:uncharacterized protein (TIGR00255 family)
VNSRFLDLQFRINDDLRSLEPLLREAIMAKTTRGKVECRLSFGRKVQTDQALKLNEELLSNLSTLEQSVRSQFADARPFSVSELLRWPGVLAESELSQESLQAEVQTLLAETLVPLSSAVSEKVRYSKPCFSNVCQILSNWWRMSHHWYRKH